MKIVCCVCHEEIKGKGVIHGGKAYHEDCWGEVSDTFADEEVKKLEKEFKGVSEDDLTELYDSFGDLEKLQAVLRSNWVVITREGGTNIEACVCNTKKEMLEWIEEGIQETMPEDYAWDILYILNKGKTKNMDLKIIVK